MQEIKIHCKGLYTHPSDLADAPDGALSVADNIVIDHEDIAEPRRGFGRSSSGFTGGTDTAKKLAVYQNYLFAHLASNILVYYSQQLAANSTAFTTTGSWTTVSGSYSPPSGTKIRFAEANQNLYFTTSKGVYKLDAYNNTPIPAGGYKGLDVTTSLVSATGNWLPYLGSVAYQVVWGIKDANQNLVLGAPSSRAVVTNTSAFTTTATTTGGTNSLTSVASTSGITVGQSVTGAGIATGSTVVGISGSTVTISSTVTPAAFATTANTTSGSAQLSNVTNATGIIVGMTITGTGIPSSTTILSVSGTTVTMSANATATNTATAVTCTMIQTGVVCTFASSQSIQLSVVIPNGVTTAWFYQIYRSATVDTTFSTPAAPIIPNDELGLVYEANPSASDITNGFVAAFNDIVPDVLRGATIYTAASQQGLANSYERPPLAKDIAVYRNVTFYANTLSKQRLYLNMLAVGGTKGVQHGDTVSVGGQTFTAQFNTEDASTNKFKLDSLVTTGTTTSSSTSMTSVAVTTGLAVGQTISAALGPSAGIPAGTTITAISGTTITMSAAATASASGLSVSFSTGASAAQSIQDASTSLCRVVNQNTSCTVYAYYLSDPTTLPGQMLFEERSIGGGIYSATGANATAWSPAISGTGAPSTNDTNLNAVYYSLTSQPEAVPLGNFFLVGSAQKQILRILPLRDSLFILKEDGVFRLSGLDSSSFRVDPFDATTHLLAPDSAVVLNNQIFALTDQGVVSVSEAGVQVRSRPIEYDLLSLQGQNYSVLKSESFGVNYDTERKYILFVPRLAGDTSPSQAYVFNTFTNTWTRWTLSKTCGLVNPGPVGDDKLYLGDSATNYVNQERKSFSYQDYVDYGFPASISAVSGNTLTMTNTDLISVGDVIYQSSSVYSTVSAVDPVAGTVTTTVTAAFTVASADVLKAIASNITWVPVTAGNPGLMKQYREVTVLFKSDFTGNGTLTFTSDTSPSQEMETLVGTPIGTWGLFAWGGVAWGGTNNRRPIRVYVPTDMQRCSQLTIGFSQSTGYAKYQLNGLSLIGNTLAEKVAY